MEDHIPVLGQGKVPRRIPDSGKFHVMPFSEFVLVLVDNRVDWLTVDGVPIGYILAKGPIRRVYSTPDGIKPRPRNGMPSFHLVWPRT